MVNDNVKPPKGFFGDNSPKVNYAGFDSLGLDDGGLLEKSLKTAEETKKRF